MYVNMSVRMLVHMYVHNTNLSTIQIVWKLNVGVFTCAIRPFRPKNGDLAGIGNISLIRCM